MKFCLMYEKLAFLLIFYIVLHVVSQHFCVCENHIIFPFATLGIMMILPVCYERCC